MATTKNHKITGTLKRAIDYAMNDKMEDSLKDDIRDSVAYAIDDKTGKVTYPTYSTVLNCKRGHPVNTFNALIEEHGKTEAERGSSRTKDGKPILAWHFHQNFEGHVDPVIANEIGVRLAKELFGKFPVVVGTHTNTENTHNHIIICAWDMDGKKWHQHNAAYRKLREVSDRLCEEYGLSVLRDTQKQKLIRWEDENGEVHYYEPTERKNELIRQRDSGELTMDDVGSYRNTVSYDKTISKEETNCEIVRQDIDRLLPVATSYEHLLEMLRQIGYSIKDKKKNGDWLKHIVFQPPTADKGTRDYKIGDGGFYLRENLERVIAEFQADRAEQESREEAAKTSTQKKSMPQYYEEYVYGDTIIADIDEDERTVKGQDGSFSTVKRSETERTVIRDLKVMDSELRLLDTSKIDQAIKEKQSQRQKPSQQRVARIEEQIKESFHVLRFMEKQDLYSTNQINSITASTWAKYNECMKNLDTLEGLVAQLEAVLKVPDKIEIIEQRIERMKDNRDYRENEMEADKEQLKKYRAISNKFELSSPESVERLSVRVSQSKAKIEQLQGVLALHRDRLAEYDRCVAVLKRIDKEQGRETEDYVMYQKIKRDGESEAKQTEEKRNKRKAAER
jgi:hypothetical protein